MNYRELLPSSAPKFELLAIFQTFFTGGIWLPVEAKINLLAEPRYSQQLGKYTKINSFTPTQGDGRRQNFTVSQADACLVVDQRGIYLHRNVQFVKCDLNRPPWTRAQMAAISIREIRAKLLELLVA